MVPPSTKPSFREAARFWLKLGLISFGGPTGQIAIMHEELVEKKKWVDEDQFLHALNFCMLLPGPEAQQLATYIGWVLHRTKGGLVAGLLFVLPAALLLWVLSWIYVSFGEVSWVTGVFHGLKPAVLAIVLSATVRIGSRVLKNGWLGGIAMFAFVGILFFKVPFPVVILSAGVAGWLAGRITGGRSKPAVLKESVPDAFFQPRLQTSRRFLGRMVGVGLKGLAIWWLPVILVGDVFGWGHTLFQEGIFFSKAAMVTFGGAYAVLPYVAQQAVVAHGWLSAPQMIDGLGLAETTPGPLVIVLQFVGFVGAFQHPGNLSPLVAGTFGAMITTWVTFAPCFLWIFIGAPYVEVLRNNVRLTAALSGVTAAVVGVVLNLAVWFAAHVFWVGQRIDWFVSLVAVIAFLGLWRQKWNLMAVIGACGVAGLLFRLLGGGGF